MTYEREEEVAIAAVIAAAQLCQRVRVDQELMTFSKPDCSPVTVADFGAQALICRAITEAFPRDAIVAEETAALLQNLTWLNSCSKLPNKCENLCLMPLRRR